MENTINLELPRYLAFSMKMSDEDFTEEFKRLALVKLYELGRLSSGNAASILGISRIDFIDLLSKYSVSIFNEQEIQKDVSSI